LKQQATEARIYGVAFAASPKLPCGGALDAEPSNPFINQYFDKRAAKVPPKTLNAEREILFRLFRFAIEYGDLIYPDPRLKNPVDGARPRKRLAHDIRFLTLEQISK
jgi:hypothetical protein